MLKRVANYPIVRVVLRDSTSRDTDTLVDGLRHLEAGWDPQLDNGGNTTPQNEQVCNNKAWLGSEKAGSINTFPEPDNSAQISDTFLG